jgi:hypothetical protein
MSELKTTSEVVLQLPQVSEASTVEPSVGSPEVVLSHHKSIFTVQELAPQPVLTEAR